MDTLKTPLTPLRDGMRVVLGSFVLLGAPLIAAGLLQGSGEFIESPLLPPPVALETKAPRTPLPPTNYDPYAGASLGQN